MARSKANGNPKQSDKSPPSPIVLLVQTDAAQRSDLHSILERNGFRVVPRASVADALLCLPAENFAALICDLQLPAAGDGFTLINAMRHLHPEAISVTMSKYPALRESLVELLPQADEVLIAPMPLQDVVDLLKNRLRDPKHRPLGQREQVSTILERFTALTIRHWTERVNADTNLTQIKLTENARSGHLRTLLNEVVHRLKMPRLDEGKAKLSLSAFAHGQMRNQQGYSAAMLVEESRILQVCIFKTLRNNLNAVDLALVLTDVMTIADEVDSQLKQTMDGFTAASSVLKNGKNRTGSSKLKAPSKSAQTAGSSGAVTRP